MDFQCYSSWKTPSLVSLSKGSLLTVTYMWCKRLHHLGSERHFLLLWDEWGGGSVQKAQSKFIKSKHLWFKKSILGLNKATFIHLIHFCISCLIQQPQSTWHCSLETLGSIHISSSVWKKKITTSVEDFTQKQITIQNYEHFFQFPQFIKVISHELFRSMF